MLSHPSGDMRHHLRPGFELNSKSCVGERLCDRAFDLERFFFASNADAGANTDRGAVTNSATIAKAVAAIRRRIDRFEKPIFKTILWITVISSSKKRLNRHEAQGKGLSAEFNSITRNSQFRRDPSFQREGIGQRGHSVVGRFPNSSRYPSVDTHHSAEQFRG